MGWYVSYFDGTCGMCRDSAQSVGRGKAEGLLFSEFSASRRRRSRACWSVERDSLMRETASLSGCMLKLPIVWWMS